MSLNQEQQDYRDNFIDAATAALYIAKRAWANAAMGAVKENQHGDTAKIGVASIATELLRKESCDLLKDLCPPSLRVKNTESADQK